MAERNWIEISSKDSNDINNNDASPIPKILHLCADLFRLSKPNEGICDPKTERIEINPIPKREISSENELININEIVIKTNVNAKDAHVSPLDSENVSDTPPIMSAIIINDEKKIKDNAASLGDNEEMESLKETTRMTSTQRIITKRAFRKLISFAKNIGRA